jgi:hypothetical protein
MQWPSRAQRGEPYAETAPLLCPASNTTLEVTGHSIDLLPVRVSVPVVYSSA